MNNNNLTVYRKRNSFQATLMKLVEDWKRSLKDLKVVGVSSTDLPKAFDSLHPPLLLANLRAYGFSDAAIGLFSVVLLRKKK